MANINTSSSVFNTQKERRAILEPCRKVAGGHALVAPVEVVEHDQRKSHSLIRMRFDVRHINFTPENPPAMPLAGDVLGIYPENSSAHIRLLEFFLRSSDARYVRMSGRYETKDNQIFTYNDALKHVKLAPVSIELLVYIKQRIEQDASYVCDKKSLNLLNQLLHEYTENKTLCESKLEHMHVLDVLRAFPDLINVQELGALQGANYRRVYTIAGVQRRDDFSPESIDILVATRSGFHVPEHAFGSGKYYQGAGSSFALSMLNSELKNRENSSAEIFIQQRIMGLPEKQRAAYPGVDTHKIDDAFKARLKAPLLCVVAGSGVSGALSALQERVAWKQHGFDVGGVTLVYGLRNKIEENLVQKDIEAYQKSGVLEKIIYAESRPYQGKGCYVQHVLMRGECNAELKECAQSKRALMLCGDKRMGEEVTKVSLPAIFSTLDASKDSNQATEKKHIHGTFTQAQFKRGQQLVNALKEGGVILQSTSGTRFEHPEIGGYEAFARASVAMKSTALMR